jgi:hypothetical protein
MTPAGNSISSQLGSSFQGKWYSMEKAGGTARPSRSKSHLAGHSPPASHAGPRVGLALYYLAFGLIGCDRGGGPTEYTELQLLLSGVHSVMRVKLALASEGGGGCTSTPSHYIYHHQ